MASTGRGLPFVLVTALALLAGCANDTGRPRETGGDRLPFEEDPSSPPVIAPPALSPNTVGMSQAGATPPPPVVDAMSCFAANSTGGLFSDVCVECACDMNPRATSSCNLDCWQLLACVAHNCAKTDTNCIIQRCNPSGDLSKLSATGNFARAVPIEACASKCFPDLLNEEAGVENDF